MTDPTQFINLAWNLIGFLAAFSAAAIAIGAAVYCAVKNS